jgi:hypothetical protein
MRPLAVVLVAALGCSSGANVTFDDAEVLSQVTSVGAAPMIALSPTGRQTVAWVSAPDGGADGRLYTSTDGAQPTELRDAEGGIEPHGEAPPKVAYAPDGTLHALYAVGRLEAGRRFPFTTLRLASSTDGGRTWDAPRTVTGDSIPRSRNFHALHVAADGSLFVAWLESRADSASATYLTRSDDQGRTWSRAVRVAAGEACPCCRVAIATTPSGRMYLAWRTVLPGNIRDIVVATSEDRGGTWTEPVRVHEDDWVFEGCPHAGPDIEVDASGALHVAWWTGREGSSGAWYARSTDGGRSFAPPVPLGVAHFSAPAHLQLALDDRGTVVAAWDDGRDTLPRVVVRVSRDGGSSFGEAVPVGAPDVASAFPVVALQGGALTVAWSQRTPEGHAHSAHSAPDMSDPSSVMPLPAVGAQQVFVRRGLIDRRRGGR